MHLIKLNVKKQQKKNKKKKKKKKKKTANEKVPTAHQHKNVKQNLAHQ